MNKRQKIFLAITGIVLLTIMGLFIYFLITNPEVEKEPVSVMRFLCIGLIVCGITGLKLITN